MYLWCMLVAVYVICTYVDMNGLILIQNLLASIIVF